MATLLMPALVSAQATGGSFGGGDWGGSSSTPSYGGGGSYSPPSYDSPSYDYGSSNTGSSGSGGGDIRSVLIAVALFALVALVVFIWDRVDKVKAERHARFLAERGYRGPGQGAWKKADITALTLAIDWRARARVQQGLETMAKRGDPNSKNGRSRLLQETVRLLRDSRISWLYASIRNFRPMSQSSAQGIFSNLALDARARFSTDVIRSDSDGVHERAPAALRARPEEGPGVVVVTLLVASRRELADVRHADDAGSVDELLAIAAGVSRSDLIAIEVVWSPAADHDRLSTAELEALYPELARLAERSIGGRIFCGYCAGPYPEELPKCVHCGAPTPTPSVGA